MDETLRAIAQYREEGIEMTCDIHPYPATYTTLSAVVLPPWVAQDGLLKERMHDNAVRKRIYKKVYSNMAWIGGPDKIRIARFGPEPSFLGKTLAAIAQKTKSDPVKAAMDIIGQDDPSCVFHALRDEDVGKVVCSEHAMVASDGFVVTPDRSVVHPRNFGTFPRIIREYVREKKQLTMQTAIRKMTGLPARKFGIKDRGHIAPGKKADLVVFDEKRIADKSTFKQPCVYPAGIKYVIVNGSIAYKRALVARNRYGVAVKIA
jgi:N-acyl-D-amino-acid deacylase